ncbi:MAG: ATP-dependent Clp protease adapter ClpS [Rhodobacterales bacterium]|nr:ATP-dependent Clp protease adapter ClpS [Rhodobacterales bacterium]
MNLGGPPARQPFSRPADAIYSIQHPTGTGRRKPETQTVTRPQDPLDPKRSGPPARAADDDGPQGPGGGDGGPGTGVVTKVRPKTKKPAMYKVLMLNDDYTPMEFVVHVLERYFSMNNQRATEVMLHVHQRGVGVCGVYTYEVAETKVTQVMDLARQHQHPLQCTIEKDGDD